LAGQVLAESALLHPSADTSLFASFPDNNLGSNSNLVSGVNGSGLGSRALLRFDVAGQIPSNAVIRSATLTLAVVAVPGGGGVASIFDLRRVLTNWTEGTGTGNSGSPANDGETTWNNRLSPASPWTTPGGAISNDYSGAVSAALLITNIGSYSFASTPGLVADVQQWLRSPGKNFGWVLMSESESTAFTAKRFGAREDTNSAPVLVVDYFVPVAPNFDWIKAAGGVVQMSFPASVGQSYSVEYRDSFNSGSWMTLTNVGLQTIATNVLILDQIATKMHRFYRISTF
jgi:hypothetical protein